jgi:hypothetical protein
MTGDTVRLYAQRTTHVVLDVIAFAARSSEYVERAPKVAGASNLAGPTRKPPAWFTRGNG